MAGRTGQGLSLVPRQRPGRAGGASSAGAQLTLDRAGGWGAALELSY